MSYNSTADDACTRCTRCTRSSSTFFSPSRLKEVSLKASQLQGESMCRCSLLLRFTVFWLLCLLKPIIHSHSTKTPGRIPIPSLSNPSFLFPRKNFPPPSPTLLSPAHNSVSLPPPVPAHIDPLSCRSYFTPPALPFKQPPVGTITPPPPFLLSLLRNTDLRWVLLFVGFN